MWKLAPYLRLVRASALYDLLVTAPFATPWSLAWLLRQLDELGQALGLAPLAVFPPEALLLGNLLGSLVCVWAGLRLIRPSLLLGSLDAVARGCSPFGRLGRCTRAPVPCWRRFCWSKSASV